MNLHDNPLLDHHYLTEYFTSNSKPLVLAVLGTILEFTQHSHFLFIFQDHDTFEIISWTLRNLCYIAALIGFVRGWRNKGNKKDSDNTKN